VRCDAGRRHPAVRPRHPRPAQKQRSRPTSLSNLLTLAGVCSIMVSLITNCMPRSQVARQDAEMFSRERQMRRFKLSGHAQRFLSAHDGISNLVPLRRPCLSAAQNRAAWTQAFQTWAEVTGITAQA